MVLITCQCLNIKISSSQESSKFKFLSYKELQAEFKDAFLHEFFSKGVYCISPESVQLSYEQSSLVKYEMYDYWNVKICVNCNYYCCGNNVKTGQFAITPHMFTEELAINKIKKHAQYSPFFKIALPREHLTVESTDQDKYVTQEIRDKINIYINKYIEDMKVQTEKDIQNYVKSKRENLELTCKRAFKDSKAFARLVVSSMQYDEKNKKNISQDNKNANQQSINPNTFSSIFELELLEKAKMERLPVQPTSTLPYQQPPLSSQKPSTTVLPTYQSTPIQEFLPGTISRPEDDGYEIFTTVEEDVQRTELINSVIESNRLDMYRDRHKEEHDQDSANSTTDDEVEDIPAFNQNRTERRQVLAKSVPISINFGHQMRHHKMDTTNDEIPQSVDIAASMQEMARSFRDSANLFGELPRRSPPKQHDIDKDDLLFNMVF